LDSNSNTLPATAQHKAGAGQINAGHWQANEVVSTAGPRFALSKMDSIDSIVKDALVLLICMEYSHRPSPYVSFLSKLANRNAVLEAIFRVPTEASSNPLLGRSEPCMARFRAEKHWRLVNCQDYRKFFFMSISNLPKILKLICASVYVGELY